MGKKDKGKEASSSRFFDAPRQAKEITVKFSEDVSDDFGGGAIVSAKKGEARKLPRGIAEHYIKKGKAKEE